MTALIFSSIVSYYLLANRRFHIFALHMRLMLMVDPVFDWKSFS